MCAYQLTRDEVFKYRLEDTVKIIVQASYQLKCSKFVRAKALTLYHYFRRCVHEIKYESYIVAAATLSLSIKFFEEPIEFDAIIICMFNILGVFPSVHDEDFMAIRKSLTDMECILLRMIEFSLDHVLTHQHLIYFMEDVKDFFGQKAWDTFISLCFTLADDFYLSGKCLNYKSSNIAAVIILVAFYYLGTKFTDPNCCLLQWVKKLCNVPSSIRCDIIEDIFEVCCLKPIAEDGYKKISEMLN